MVWSTYLWFLAVAAVASALRIVKQYENLVVFTLGKYTGTKQPGLRLVFPVIQSAERVDLRLRTIDIPTQQMMTKDNVPVHVNGVIYFKVTKPDVAVIKIENYVFAISQYAETALRDVVGGMDLDSVLSKRDEIGDKIRAVVQKETSDWGLVVDHIKLQDVEVPDDLKRLMSRQAAAEREKRATIIKAEGDKLAASNLAAAAKTMRAQQGALQLRTLQTIDGLGPTASNTVVLAVPLDVMEALGSYIHKGDKK